MQANYEYIMVDPCGLVHRSQRRDEPPPYCGTPLYTTFTFSVTDPTTLPSDSVLKTSDCHVPF